VALLGLDELIAAFEAPAMAGPETPGARPTALQLAAMRDYRARYGVAAAV
jgi:hypothetical protein